MHRAYLLLLLIICGYTAGYAQFLPFGKNKIQYNPPLWKKIETEHFTVYYYDSLKDVALSAVPVIETAYKTYITDFGQTVNYRIPLIIYNTHNHFAQTNVIPGILPEGIGGFFEYIKGRVVIPFNGSTERFHHVLRHELVHVFTNSRLTNILRERRVAQDRYPPLWYTEGLAEFLSSGIDAQGEMVMRDAVVIGYFPALEDFDRIRGSYLMYKGGQVFLEFVALYYSRQAVMNLLNNMWLSADFRVVIEQTLGESLVRLGDKWRLYLQRRFFRTVLNQVDPSDSMITYTPPGYHFSPAVLQKNGINQVFFLSNADGYTSVFSAQKGDNPLSIPEIPRMEVRGEKDADYEVLHLMQRSLAVYKDSLLCFVAKSGGKDKVYFYSFADKKVTNIPLDDRFISVSDPAFHSSKCSLLFRGIGATGYSDIYEYDILNSVIKQITYDTYDDRNPVYTHHGDIVFASSGRDGDCNNVSNIFTIKDGTTITKRLTHYNAELNSPYINDSGNLYFSADFSGVKELYKYDLKQNKVVAKIGSSLTGIMDPYFKGNEVFYSAYNEGSFSIQSLPLTVQTEISETSNGEKNNCFSKTDDTATVNIFEEKVYRRDYAVDFAASQFSSDPVYGNRGGGALTLSDLLGDDSYEFVFYNTAEVQSDFLKSFNVAISRFLSTPGWNYSYGVFHFNGRRYDLRESDDYFFERSYGTYFSLIKPHSFFSRTEVSASVINSDKDLFGSFQSIKSTLFSTSVSWVYDNSLWFGTGAIDGTRIRLLAGYTGDIKNKEVHYYTLIGDYRKYFRLGLYSSLAARASIYFNEGKAARRYIMGGSWDLRGYPRFSLRGEKMWLTSVELRTPLIDQFIIRFPALLIPLGMVRGALFFDAGSTWDKNYFNTYGSLGVGFRINLFNALALRYDMGKTIEHNFTKLQKGLFYQFFFGWDF